MSLLDFRRSVKQDLIDQNPAAPEINNWKRTSNESKQSISRRRKYYYSVSADVKLGNRGSHWITFVKENWITFVKERRICE